MTTTSFVPPVYAPPHDPKWWLLGASAGRTPSAGWRSAVAGQLDLLPDPNVLTLPVRGGGLGALADDHGTLGGLVPPKNVALDGTTIYLMDREARRLKYFDRCECAFRTLPCLDRTITATEDDPCTEGLGWDGSDPRALGDPEAIAIDRGDLFIADSGRNRLAVFALFGLVYRGCWEPPPTAGLAPWRPVDVAFDRWSRVYVADPANGCIHRFSRRGVWERCFDGLGALRRIVIDCHDRILVLTGVGTKPLRIIDLTGTELPIPTRTTAITEHLARPGFDVDTNGNLYLGAWCDPPVADGGTFDRRGAPVIVRRPNRRYESAFTIVLGPLDSRIYRCQWHRVMLDGHLPPNSRVGVDTYTSESEEPAELIGPADWVPSGTASRMRRGGWDGLVRSRPGRYLWLRLELRGDGSVTPTVDAIRTEYPRVSLRRYLPSVYAQDPVAADFSDRFLAIFDTTFRSIERHADEFAKFFDPDSAPARRTEPGELDFLTWLGRWVGIALDRQMPEARRRSLLRSAARLYHIRGTRDALRQQLSIAMGLDEIAERFADTAVATRCTPGLDDCGSTKAPLRSWLVPELILEHHQLRRWLYVGKGRLSGEAILWGQQIVNRSQLDSNARVGGTQLKTTQDPLRDPFHHYAHTFTVFVPACFAATPHAERSLINLIEAGKPAHTKYALELVEPRFRIGFQSSIGLNAVVGRYPEGVVLRETRLDRSTVLGSGRPARGPSMEIGKASQVGTTTRLS